jgi:hypothetical protein
VRSVRNVVVATSLLAGVPGKLARNPPPHPGQYSSKAVYFGEYSIHACLGSL